MTILFIIEGLKEMPLPSSCPLPFLVDPKGYVVMPWDGPFPLFLVLYIVGNRGLGRGPGVPHFISVGFLPLPGIRDVLKIPFKFCLKIF